MKVRFPTQCPRCHRMIGVGEIGTRPFGRPIWHLHCAAEYAHTRGYTLQDRLDRKAARVA